MPKRRSRTRRRRTERPDPELERRRADELARRRVLEANRKRLIAAPAMAQHDARDPLVRCLVSFYGENAVAGCQCNADQVPRRLGREAEFWLEWESWQRIGAAQRERALVDKAKATERLSEFF